MSDARLELYAFAENFLHYHQIQKTSVEMMG